MRRLSRHGRWPWMLAGIASGGVVACVVWSTSALSPTPEWRQRLDADVPLFAPGRPGLVDADSNAAQARILNDVLRRPVWDAPEAAELCALIRAGYPEPLSPGRRLPPAEFGAVMVHASASLAVLARLEVGAPMTPAARGMILDALLDELTAPYAERRCGAAMTLIVSRSIEEAPIREAVERLTEDPDGDTAEVIRMQLSHYDDQRARVHLLAQRSADRE